MNGVDGDCIGRGRLHGYGTDGVGDGVNGYGGSVCCAGGVDDDVGGWVARDRVDSRYWVGGGNGGGIDGDRVGRHRVRCEFNLLFLQQSTTG